MLDVQALSAPCVYASDPRMVSFPPAAPSLSTSKQAAPSSVLLARSAPVVRQLPPSCPRAAGNIPPSAPVGLGTACAQPVQQMRKAEACSMKIYPHRPF